MPRNKKDKTKKRKDRREEAKENQKRKRKSLKGSENGHKERELVLVEFNASETPRGKRGRRFVRECDGKGSVGKGMASMLSL